MVHIVHIKKDVVLRIPDTRLSLRMFSEVLEVKEQQLVVVVFGVERRKKLHAVQQHWVHGVVVLPDFGPSATNQL